MNGHIKGVCRQTEKLEPQHVSIIDLGVKWLKWTINTGPDFYGGGIVMGRCTV